MWTFLGLVVVAGVLWYWLRRIARSLIATGAVIEASLNRAAVQRGETPISDQIDTRSIF